MTDTPERIVVYHDEEVGQLAQRAESLTIDNVNIRATQTQLQEPLGREINPITGHMAGADPADNFWRYSEPWDRIDQTPPTGAEAAEEIREEAEAVEETLEEDPQCLDPEERDKERPYHPTWTTSYSDKAPTYLQEISERPESLSRSGTFTGASITTQR